MKKLFFRIISKQVKKARRDGIKKGREQGRQETKKEYQEKNKKQIQEIKKELQQIIVQKNNEISKLKKQISSNREKYNYLRKRENELTILQEDTNNIVETMLIRIHEATQPFLRQSAKIDAMKRKSDKKDAQISNIFEMVK
ncbi:MAG: hypothetical protein PVI88_00320 [Nitrosopumilaceae archaeon]|jgi:hypothetical protein